MRIPSARGFGIGLLVLAATMVTALHPGGMVEAHAEPATYTITEADNGRHIHVKSADLVRITLVPPANARWTPPAGHSTYFFRQWLSLDSAATTAVYRAYYADDVTLVSRLDYACTHEPDPCSDPGRTFSVRVTIEWAPSPSPSEGTVPSPTPSPSPSCTSPPPVMTTSEVPGAVELGESDDGGATSLRVGQRISLRVSFVAYGVYVPRPGLFVEQWYVNDDGYPCPTANPRSHVVVRALAATPSGDALVTDEGVCDYYRCGRPNYDWRHRIEVTPEGSTAAALATRLSHASITAGNAPTVTALLTTTTGEPARGYVTLHAREYGVSHYRPIATAHADNGEAIFTVRPTIQTAYVAVVTGAEGQRLATDSRVISVHARVVVERPAVGGALDGNSTPVTGYLLPRRDSVPVGVLAPLGRGYRYLGQASTTWDGQFSVQVSDLPPGMTTLTVYTSARAGTLRGSTRVRVHAG